jgi:hypothetical protein
MDPKAFIDTRTKRCMAQTLEEFEDKVERPVRALLTAEPVTAHQLEEIISDMDSVKRTIRKKIQALAADCLDLVPSDIQINGFEPVTRR